MHTVFWVFIAAAFGLLLFTGLQDQIPDELSFLKSSNIEQLGDPGAPQRQNFTYQKWHVRQEGAVIELTRAFTGRIEVGGTVYDNPELGILCNAGKLDVRVDTRMPVTGTATTPVTYTGGGRQVWTKGTRMNIFPPDAEKFVASTAKALQPREFVFSYVDFGNQTVVLDSSGLLALVQQLPKGCNPT